MEFLLSFIIISVKYSFAPRLRHFGRVKKGFAKFPELCTHMWRWKKCPEPSELPGPLVLAQHCCRKCFIFLVLILLFLKLCKHNHPCGICSIFYNNNSSNSSNNRAQMCLALLLTWANTGTCIRCGNRHRCG